jgi:hypothetical protein
VNIKVSVSERHSILGFKAGKLRSALNASLIMLSFMSLLVETEGVNTECDLESYECRVYGEGSCVKVEADYFQ